MMFPVEDPILNDQLVNITVENEFPDEWMSKETDGLITPAQASKEAI